MEERYSSKLVTDLMLTRENNGKKEVLLALLLVGKEGIKFFFKQINLEDLEQVKKDLYVP